MDEFNIWDLERVHIKIDIKVLQTINEKIFSRFKTKRKAYFKIFDKKEIPFDTFRNLLKYSYISWTYQKLFVSLLLKDLQEFPFGQLTQNISNLCFLLPFCEVLTFR